MLFFLRREKEPKSAGGSCDSPPRDSIRHSRMATLTLAMLVASLGLRLPASATGGGRLRPPSQREFPRPANRLQHERVRGRIDGHRRGYSRFGTMETRVPRLGWRRSDVQRDQSKGWNRLCIAGSLPNCCRSLEPCQSPAGEAGCRLAASDGAGRSPLRGGVKRRQLLKPR